MPYRILRLPAVKEMTGLSRTGIYLAMNDDTFPKAIPLSDRAVGWLESEVQNWIHAKVQRVRGGRSKAAPPAANYATLK